MTEKAQDWLIAIPCWGEDYFKRFLRDCWPSMSVALGAVRGNLRFAIHSKDPPIAQAMQRVFKPYESAVYGLRGERHTAFSNTHRDVLDNIALPGEAIALLNADLVLSRECFAACEKRFREGYRIINVAATRTVGAVLNSKVPTGAASRELLDWALKFAHPIIRQCYYPMGKGGIPSSIYFDDGKNTIIRAFHLHPIAVLKEENPLIFTGTIDRDLVESFPLDKVHVVTDADEMALAEITPIEKRQVLLPNAMDHKYIAWWTGHFGTPLNNEFFRKRIVARGCSDTEIDAPAEDILKEIDNIITEEEYRTYLDQLVTAIGH